MMNPMSDNNMQSTIQDFVYALAATRGKPGGKLCFAARQSGLYLSEDGSSTWQPAYTTLNLDAPLSTTCLALSPAFETKAELFAGVPGYVMHSEDGGKDWSADPLPLELVRANGAGDLAELRRGRHSLCRHKRGRRAALR